MNLRKAALAAALGLSMASTPILAQTSSASALSVARVGAEMNEASNQEVNSDWIVPGIIIVGVLVTLAIIFLDDDESASA